jgi:gamma-glutamyl:cysteine ligase YbdK (ATP-grasp superfamily)
MGHQQPLKLFILETLEKLMPIAKECDSMTQLTSIAKIVENNAAPYQRQISSFKQNNNFEEILKKSVVELKSGFEIYA